MTASVVDAAISFKDVPDEPCKDKWSAVVDSKPKLSWTPTFQLAQTEGNVNGGGVGGAVIGLSGRF